MSSIGGVRIRVALELHTPRSSADLGRRLGVSRQAARKTLRDLEQAGLVVVVAQGREVKYQVEKTRVAHLLDEARRQLEGKLQGARATQPFPVAAQGGLLALRLGDQHWLPTDGASLLIGRDADPWLAQDPFLSARHALLHLGPTGWTLRDLGSTNGTHAAGVPLAPREQRALGPGDVIFAGSSAFRWNSPVPVPPPHSAPALPRHWVTPG